MSATEHTKFCTLIVQSILQSYPSQTAQAPQTYVEAMIRLLAEYPADDIRQLLHPRHGLVAQCQFLPTVAEARELLDDAMETRRKRHSTEALRITQDKQIGEQMRLRREMEEREPPDPEMLAKVQKLLSDLRVTTANHKLRKRR